MVDKNRVFLSYSRRDMQIASALEKDLEAAGINVWMDRHDISVGERWSAAIQRALEESYAMVLVISPDSMASENVEDEFTYFLDNRKPIVPIMVRPAKPHFQLHRIQWIDFTQGTTEKAYEQLIRALHDVGVEFQPVEEGDRTSLIAHLLDDLETHKRRERRRQSFFRYGVGILLALMLIAILVVSTMVLNNAPEATPTLEQIAGTIDGPDVVMYRLPSRDSEPIAQLPDKSPVVIKQRTENKRFVFVAFGLSEGWVLTRDILIDNEDQIDKLGVWASPTPLPTASPTPNVTATATVAPSPTPEQVLNPGGSLCVITIAAEAEARTAHFEPSFLGFSQFDTVYPNESFIATVRSGLDWLYIGIGWIRRGDDVLLNNPAVCDALPEEPTRTPDRIRAYIKNLGLVEFIKQTDPTAARPISTETLTGDALLAAQAWNSYASLIEPLAELLSLEPRLLTALVTDEANLQGGENSLPIRFEADVFLRYLTKAQEIDFTLFFAIDPNDPTLHSFRNEKTQPFINYHESNDLEWQAFQKARTINEEAALRAVRYGATGILGDNFYLMGYVTPRAMYDAFMNDPVARVVGKLDYVKTLPNAISALKVQDWVSFALYYNVNGERTGDIVAARIAAYYAALAGLMEE